MTLAVWQFGVHHICGMHVECSFLMMWDACGTSKKVKTFNITFIDTGFPSVNVGLMWDF